MEKNTSKQIDLATAMNNNPFQEVVNKVSAFNEYVVFLHNSIRELQLENSRLDAKLSEQKGYRDCSDELEKKSIELSEKTAECRCFERKCASLDTELSKLKGQLNEATRGKKEIELELDYTKRSFRELSFQKTDVERDNNEKGKSIERLGEEKKEIEQELLQKNEEITELTNTCSELNNNYENEKSKIAGFEKSIMLFYNGIITSIKNCINAAMEQIENEALRNYLSEINLNTSDSYEKTINDVDGIVLHESSALCRLLTIRMWAKQSEMQHILFEKYDFTSLIMLTENLVNLTRHFGYEISMLDCPIAQKDLKVSGYSSAQEYAKVTPKIFPEYCNQQEQNIYCEFRELSYVKSQCEPFKGSLFYVEGKNV